MTGSSDRVLSIYQTMMKQDYFTKWLGIELLGIDEGQCQIKMVVRQEMLNGLGILHGGVAFSLADSCIAFAANAYGRATVTLNANIIFSKSAKAGDVLIAEAVELNLSHKTGNFDVNIYEEVSKEIWYRFRATVYRSNKDI